MRCGVAPQTLQFVRSRANAACMYHDPLVTRCAVPDFLVPKMAEQPLVEAFEAVVIASEPCDGEIVAVGELVAPAHPELPPGRVRHMFKKLGPTAI